MFQRHLKNEVLLATLLAVASCNTAFAQQTNNSSTLNNSAAPSASSITSGGTNINYQTNNSFNNENGFGPGIFCRTPSLYVGGSWGNTNQNNIDISSNTSSNSNQSYSANIGVVVPFGSSILRECTDLSHQLTLDRKISTDLSLIRACSQLEKEGISVDPERFPYLEKCARPINSPQRMQGLINPPGIPRSSSSPQLTPKIPKVTKS
jgi:hypothetical protein